MIDLHHPFFVFRVSLLHPKNSGETFDQVRQIRQGISEITMNTNRMITMQTLRLIDRRGPAPDEPDTLRYAAYSGTDPFLGKRDPLS
jgi:hypothetical protein